MSTVNDPTEVTIEKNGNLIILIDQHNLSADTVLDMAARAMLGAGYDKSQVVQAALAYAGQHEVSEGTAEALKRNGAQSPLAPVAPLSREVAVAESRETLIPEPAESKNEPSLSARNTEPETPEIEEVTASSREPTPEVISPVTDLTEEAEIPLVPVATETTTPSEALSQAMIDEVLAADRNRLQTLVAASNGTKSVSEPVADNPVNPDIPAWAVPAWPAPLTPESESVSIPLDENANPQEADQVAEMATAQGEWLNQKLDPNNTSSSMLIPPMPEIPEIVDQEPVTPPEEPVEVVAPVAVKPPATLLSRLTGFVKLDTMAIPRYPDEADRSTISTPKPVARPVLAPPLSAPTNR